MPAHRSLFTISLVFVLAAFELACHKNVSAAASSAPAPAPASSTTTAPAEEEAKKPEETAQTKKTSKRSTVPVATIPPTSPANPPLRLGDMLTPEQERQYNAAMDLSLQRAQANIALVSKRRLSKEQQGVVVQVQSFIEHAQNARKTNLTAAKSLAERADVLARELARTVK